MEIHVAFPCLEQQQDSEPRSFRANHHQHPIPEATEPISGLFVASSGVKTKKILPPSISFPQEQTQNIQN